MNLQPMAPDEPGGHPKEPSLPSAGGAPRRWLWGMGRWVVGSLGLGMLGACGFPLVIAALGPTPCLEGGPRELGVGLLAAGLFMGMGPEVPLRRQVAQAWWTGLGFFAVLFYWLDIAMVQFGGMPQALALPLVALLVALCALFYGLLPLFYNVLRSGMRLPPVLAFGAAVVVQEWLRGGAFLGFPWGLWGYSQARNPVALVWARWAGVYGVSFWLAVLGAGAVVALRQRGGRALGVWTLGVVVWVGGGIWGLRPLPPPVGSVSLGVVQAAIPQDIKNHAAEHAETIVDTYTQLSQQALKAGAEVLVWPEGAWPLFVSANANRLPLPVLGKPLLLGAPSFAKAPLRAYNSAFWLDAQGAVRGRYVKQHLVPFGEYVPLRGLLPVDKLVPGSTDFTAGTSAAPLGEPPLGVLICYDGVFPEIGRAETLAGAQALVNLTNDAWYGISSAPYQHRDFYVLRAVETGRWVVRAANTGLSLRIDPYGGLHGETQLGAATHTVGRVELYDHMTFYAQRGDALVAACLVLLLLAGLRMGAAVWYTRHHDH